MKHWRLRGVPFSYASYVDNSYALGRTPREAEKMLDELERELHETWALDFKASSRMTLIPDGSAEAEESDERWVRGTRFTVLGLRLRGDGRQCDDVAAGLRAAWAGFWANPGQLRSDRRASVSMKLRLMQRTTTPLWSWRAGAWAPTRGMARQLNAAQRKMTASLITVAPIAGEEPQQYVRRRARAAGALCRAKGLWSKTQLKRARDWKAHLDRAVASGSKSWAARMLGLKQLDWLRQKRAEANSPGTLAGATGTRARGGAPAARWQEALERAEAAGEAWHRV